MPHFFIKSENVNGNNILINDIENYKHIAKSLRAAIGESLLLIDENEIQYETKILEISKNSINVEVIDSYKSERKLPFQLDLAQSPLRSDAQLVIMEKATELGVNKVYPVYTDNCALKKNVIEAKIEKWQNTMYAASKQCERANIPTCEKMTTLSDVINNGYDKVLALCERNTETSLKRFLTNNPIKAGERVLVIIGPEGGFSQAEFEFFKENNIPQLSLGELILKAETAVIVTLGDIVYEYNK